MLYKCYIYIYNIMLHKCIIYNIYSYIHAIHMCIYNICIHTYVYIYIHTHVYTLLNAFKIQTTSRILGFTSCQCHGLSSPAPFLGRKSVASPCSSCASCVSSYSDSARRGCWERWGLWPIFFQLFFKGGLVSLGFLGDGEELDILGV